MDLDAVNIDNMAPAENDYIPQTSGDISAHGYNL